MAPGLAPPRDSTFDPEDWHILAGFWHPVAFLDDISPAQPLAVRMLDVDLVVYRSGSDFVVARDVCPHRGARLTAGTGDGTAVTCPLHRRRYGADGAEACGGTSLAVFPHCARHGLLWTCFSGAPRFELPAWPELEDHSGLKHMRLPPMEWNCSVSRQVENFQDVAHLSWVHAGTFGNRERPEIPAYSLEQRPGGFHFDCAYPRKAVENHGPDLGTVEDLLLSYDLCLPFCSRLVINFPDGTHYQIYNLPAPVSRQRCRLFIRMARDFDLAGPADSSVDLQQRVLDEDRPLVEAQRPEEIPLDLTEEFHIAADRLSTSYRRALREMGLGHPLSS